MTVADGELPHKANLANRWKNLRALLDALEIGDLTGVTITSPSTGEVLTYNGSAWVNSAGVGELADLSDVATMSNLATFMTLTYTGSTWNTGFPVMLAYIATHDSSTALGASDTVIAITEAYDRIGASIDGSDRIAVTTANIQWVLACQAVLSETGGSVTGVGELCIQGSSNGSSWDDLSPRTPVRIPASASSSVTMLSSWANYAGDATIFFRVVGQDSAGALQVDSMVLWLIAIDHTNAAS